MKLVTTTTALALAFPFIAQAQNAQQLEYDRQQREYRVQMERQQEQQRQQQRLMEENARRQQEEMRRLNTPPPAPSYATPPAPSYAPAPPTTPRDGTSPQPPSSRQQAYAGAAATPPTKRPAPIPPLPPAPWRKIVSDGNVDVYVDPTSIRQTGSTRQLTELWNYKDYTPSDGVLVLSTKIRAEYDCVHQRMRSLGSTSHPRHNGEGPPARVSRDVKDWQSAASNSSFYKAACRT